MKIFLNSFMMRITVILLILQIQNRITQALLLNVQSKYFKLRYYYFIFHVLFIVKNIVVSPYHITVPSRIQYEG